MKRNIHTSTKKICKTETDAELTDDSHGSTRVLSKVRDSRGGLASSSASATVPDGIVGGVPSSSCAATSNGVAGQGEEATFPYQYSSDKGRKPFPPLGLALKLRVVTYPFLS
ncbi:hypothetical protein J6590_091057 [Homalodisca vitripennis]|nr:hypothetical protein J6590_091057 [Homalodisca vitripennis]